MCKERERDGAIEREKQTRGEGSEGVKKTKQKRQKEGKNKREKERMHHS